MNSIEPWVCAKIAGFLRLPFRHVAARKFATNKTIYDIRELDRREIIADVGTALNEYNKVWN